MEVSFDNELPRLSDERIFDYLARIHTKFQSIHPFRDGNGRIGRILINILLVKKITLCWFFQPV